MVAEWCLTMLPLLAGPLDRHTVEGSLGTRHDHTAQLQE